SMNAEFLARNLAPPSALHKPAACILSCARRLSRLVRDLLDYSQLQTRRLDVRGERIDLPRLVNASVECVAPEAPDRRFDVQVHGEVPPVNADADRIAQVMDNLLTNAIKYGEPRSTILVEVGVLESMATVAVTNQGVGISPEELPHLFQRFARTDKAKQ